MPKVQKLVTSPGHLTREVREKEGERTFACSTCRVRYGWVVRGKKVWYFAEDRRTGRLATSLGEMVGLLAGRGHAHLVEYKVDAVFGVDTEVIGPYLGDVFHRPGVKKGGGGEKEKAKKQPKKKLGTRWWQKADPAQLARETRQLRRP